MRNLLKAGAASAALISIILCSLVGFASCGFLGSKGGEPSGEGSLPLSGVGPFAKEDQDCQKDFIQPAFMDSEDKDIYWGEPWIMPVGGDRFRLFFEARAGKQVDIYLQQLEVRPAAEGSCRSREIVFLSQNGERALRPEPLLVLEGAGAPSVIHEQGVIKVWYEMESGQGIGHAEFVEREGRLEEQVRIEPVMSATEEWESGFVGSPSVLRREGLALYQMWYEGDINSQRSIGYATSPDGTVWTKRDSFGRTSEDHRGTVAPVLTPSQSTWEFHYPTDPDSGSVGTPYVILHRSPVRTLYYLYYTGNLKGKAALNLDDVDTSVGLAGSEDGLHWVKSSTVQYFGDIAWEVNPIMNEVFPLDVVNKLYADLLGQGYKYKIQGSSNAFFPWTIVDEVAPCVIDMGTVFYMVFEQTGSIDQTKGLAFALIERE